MVEYKTNYIELYKKFDGFSYEYEKKFITSLTIVSAAGLASLISFSQTYENPEIFLESILLSLWGFFFGLVFSGALPLVISIAFRYQAEHFVNAHSLHEFTNEAYKLPEMFHSSKKIADHENRERDRLLAKAKKHTVDSDITWDKFKRWSRIKKASFLIASFSIVFAIFWPLLIITIEGKLT